MRRFRIPDSGFRIVACLAVVVLAPTVRVLKAEAEATKTLALRFKPNETSVKSLGWIQLKVRYRQKGQEPIVVEAEESTRVQLASNEMTPTADAEASGGLCLQFANEIENELWIETPGDYRAWYRAFFPLRGSWNHSEQMDDGEAASVLDSEFGPDKQWLWVKGPVYSLMKGWHRYLWPAPTAWCGGARLDKIMLAPASAPEPTGKGPEASRAEVPESAELLTNRLRLDDFTSWRLAFTKEESGGAVEVDYSLDRGKTWKPLMPDKAYTVSPRDKRLTFRVRLLRSANGTTPRLRDMALVAQSIGALGGIPRVKVTNR